MSGFQPIVQHVSDGEPVSAAVNNRAPQTLEGNIRWLKDVVDAAGVGRALIDRDVPVAATVQVGMPVFFNRQAGRYEAALAAVQVDEETGGLYPSDSARVWGLVVRKTASDTADVLIHGVADVDLSAVASGSLAGKVLYLSGTTPGHLVTQQPPVSLPVALAGNETATPGVWRVLVRSDLRDTLESHKHYSVTLETRPAGDVEPPNYGDPHVIINPDPSIEGWLPANHAIFGGKAPAGAKFGYNLSQASWGSLWPPVPVKNCYIEWEFQESPVSYTAAIPVGLSQYVVTDENGIWWMTDAFGSVPWPTDLDTITETSTSYSIDYEILPTLRLWFTKPVFTSASSAVLSLQSRPGSHLQVLCRGTNVPAQTGHLDLSLDLDLASEVTDLAGFRAFKRYQNGKLDAGPVVEGIKAGTSNVVVSGVSGQSLIDAQGFVSGKALISVTNLVAGVEIPVETVHLAGAYDAFPFGIVALAFDHGKLATIYGRLTLPTQPELPTGTKMKLRLIVFCREAGNLPANVLTATYRRIPRPAAVKTPVALPTTDTALSLDTAVSGVTTNSYLVLESAPFDVTTGDIVMFSLRRAATDAYAGTIYLMRKCGVLV